MSLILEALRKSEAERRRGEAPDLQTELPPVARRHAIAAPRWNRAWTIATLLLIALAATWLAGTRPWNSEPFEPVSPSGSGPAAPAPSATDTPPVAGTVIAPGAGEVRGVAPAPVAAAPDTTRVVEPDVQAAASASPSAGGGTATSSDPAATLDASSARPPVPPVPVAPPPPPAAGAPLTLAELTPEQRRALPPLKVSMHMWSEEPVRRFVILDGQRLGEGDRTGELVVDTIRRDDVLLAWNGILLRLSLR
jgi:general secretion pathway protein B